MGPQVTGNRCHSLAGWMGAQVTVAATYGSSMGPQVTGSRCHSLAGWMGPQVTC
jgi:hypothetical protein